VAEAQAALGVCLRDTGHAAEGEKLLRESEPGLRRHPRPPFRTWVRPAVIVVR
jgi:hypothetical protein